MALDLKLTDAQKLAIEPHVKAALKSMFLAGMELGKALAENSENKIDDVVIPVAQGPLEQIVDGVIAGMKL